MKNKKYSIKEFFLKRLIYVSLIQFIVLVIVFVLVNRYFENAQHNTIAEAVLINDSYTIEEIVKYNLLGKRYALELALYNFLEERKLDSVKFITDLKEIAKINNCSTINKTEYRICHDKKGIFLGITPIKYKNKYFGYVVAKKKYDLFFPINITYGIIFIFLTVFSLYIFNFLIIFLSIRNKIEENTCNLVDFIADGKDTPELDIVEYNHIAKQFIRKKNEIALLHKEKALIEAGKAIAEQVAHDIRSPLTALDSAMHFIHVIPEADRVSIRNSIKRINDIANNLLTQYRNKTENSSLSTLGNSAPHLICDLVSNIISEKRLQYYSSNIELIDEIEDEVMSSFITLPANEFQNSISNLINNAYEAISNIGQISIKLTKEDSNLILSISDTGCGIPQMYLSKFLKGGFSVGKEHGTGLGLSSAAHFFKTSQCQFNINSIEKKGTTITIHIPISKPPTWFKSSLILHEDTLIIVLDDDATIHDVWKKRFSTVRMDMSKFVNFTHADAAESWISYHPIHLKTLFLVDYELIGQSMSGLDFIEKNNIASQSVLVSSRYSEEHLQEKCIKLGLKQIPKSYAKLVPITFVPNNLELVFIDDNTALTTAWQNKAERIGKKIITFNHIEEFQVIIEDISKDTPIYVDLMFYGQMVGRDFSRYLYEQGFYNIYLSTGYNKENIERCDWVKDIVGKQPPF